VDSMTDGVLAGMLCTRFRQFLANFCAPHSFDSSSESEVVGTFRVFLSHFDLEETPQVRFMSPGGSSRLHHSSSALYTLQSNVNRKSNESNKSYILRLKSKKVSS